MNKYLLLRDNKQSGPYSVEELITKGLKAYDLVWLEGKSAAWRYPSEIEELKPFAPAVEEQPYDRFYKKPAQQSATGQSAQVNTGTIPIAQTNATTPSIASKKIYVTLPAAPGKATAINTINISAAKKEVPVKELKEQETLPANNELPESYPVFPESTASFEDDPQTPASPSFSTLVGQSYNQQNKTTATLPLRKPARDNYKLLMRGLVAACLILGGVVIGIAITYNRQHSDNQANLDKLVQQLQNKENTGQVAGPNKPEEKGPSSTTANQQLQEEKKETVPHHQPKQDIAATEVRKEKALMPEDKRPATSDIKTPDVKIVPAVVTNKPEEKGQSNEAATSSARQHIRQLVQVEASPFKTGVLGGISQLTFTLSNNSPFSLDEVELEIKYLGPEKRVVKVQHLLFSDVAAGTQKTLEAPRTTRGVSIDYVITRINSKALGIAHAGF